MQRRLEDVSHFFLGNVTTAGPQRTTPTLTRPTRSAGPRVVYLASQGEHVTAAMVVAGIAGCLAQSGRRVLVGQTHEQHLGVVFGLCGRAVVAGSDAVVGTDLGVWLSRAPLVGGTRPGLFVDRDQRPRWDALAGESDVVIIHINHDDGFPWRAWVPFPDEFVVLADHASHESLVRSYRAIKRVVYRNPQVVLRLVTLDADQEARARWLSVADAAARFLGRRCVVDGSLLHAPGLAASFLSGRLCRDDGERVVRTVAPIVKHWVDGSPRSVGRAGRAERDAASSGPEASIRAGDQPRF